MKKIKVKKGIKVQPLSKYTTDEERSEYYNLNGTRLSSPNKGLTILRHGNSKGRIVLR